MTESVEGRHWMFNGVGRPKGFVVGKPEIIEDILSTQFKSFGKGEYVHGVLSGLMGDGIFTVDSHKWMQQRKTASNLFSMRELKESMATVVQENVNTLNEILEHSMDNGESLDLFHLLNRFTFEVISEIAFGIKFGGLVSKSVHPVEAAFNFAQQRMFERFLEPMWMWKLQRWLDVGSEHQLRKSIQVIDNTCYDIISRSMEERKTAGSAATDGKKNIISLFLDGASDDAKSDQDLDPKYLRDIVVSFMTAGRDTTTAALSWFFYTVSQHPKVEEKIRDEIFSKIPELANGVISSPSACQVSDLLYLEATVKEVLRLYPSIPSNIREALEDVVLCDGTVMKAGEAVITLSTTAEGLIFPELHDARSIQTSGGAIGEPCTAGPHTEARGEFHPQPSKKTGAPPHGRALRKGKQTELNYMYAALGMAKDDSSDADFLPDDREESEDVYQIYDDLNDPAPQSTMETSFYVKR
ncbi:Cytochrome P450 [Phytophthora infestans]|uniref:Cytochrome P450 n=1 Tax=Phytophthora infestans TaxID=4787 RepID=A0A833S0X1_PHYIN|nr:Cytochrome P450 [Phytophthora infestans]